ncbi:MAG TPA: glycosyltransferase family 2 protein [Planctomycetaceae bacterium]|nr:glycosyltransferase family 2 protein [Planctomycetaceae bacterium]
MQSTPRAPFVSVVIPAHNEAESLPALIEELQLVFAKHPGLWELLVVDDGSDDPTPAVLSVLGAQCEQLRPVRLDGRYGQSAALEAGFRSARGDVIVMLDADGQNPPHDIPRLLEALRDCDMVCGRRRQRRDSWLKRISSRIANGVRRAVLRDGIHDTGCSLKAFRRELADRFKLYRGMHRFLPALAKIEGARVREIDVEHRPRTRGTSHYGLGNRLVGPLLDLFVVVWMQRRTLRWRIESEIQPAGLDAETHAQLPRYDAEYVSQP